MDHQTLTQQACDQALKILTTKRLHFRPLARKGNQVNTKHGFIVGRANLKTGLITIDILTPKRRRPKRISAILSVLAHEVAHYQKPPFRQRYRGRFIIRRHYPAYYRQVNKNILKLKQSELLARFF